MKVQSFDGTTNEKEDRQEKIRFTPIIQNLIMTEMLKMSSEFLFRNISAKVTPSTFPNPPPLRENLSSTSKTDQRDFIRIQ